jgi:hypothetical protein
VSALTGSFSDARIKTNIIDLSSVDTLSIIDKLIPTKFNYIDTLKYSSKPTYGFIAQELETIIPEAVSIIDGFIPNIFELADLSYNCITLRNTSTNTFVYDTSRDTPNIYPTDTSGNKLKVHLYDDKNTLYTAIISNIQDDKVFYIDIDTVNEICDSSSVFVYGQSVSDFRVVDKDVVFSITTSSMIELNSQVKSLNSQVSSLTDEISILKEQINTILSKNNT